MQNKKQILQLFTKWGRDQEQALDEHGNLKIRVLNSLETKDNIKSKRPVRLFKFGFALGACALLVLLIVNYTQEPISVLDKNYVAKNLQIEDSVPGLGISYGSAVGLANTGSESSRLEKAVTAVSEFANYIVPPDQSIPSTDTREYLKLDYYATLKTRTVETIAGRIQTVVRGYGGRVDSVSVNSKYGYVGFVIPKKSFELFKAELKSLVGERFFEQSISSQNLLPQKVYIEDETKTASSTLVDYQKEKNDLTDKHNKLVSLYQSEINGYGQEILSDRQKLKNATNTLKISILKNNISYANSEISRYKKVIEDIKKDYGSKIFVIDKNIKSQQDTMVNLKTQDINLINNVETVQGTIAINWISYWEIIELYVPFYKWLIAGAVVMVILVAIYGRRRSFETL